jgi:colicin import membrane protein
MISRPLAKDTGMGRFIIVSAVIHLTVFLLVVWRGSQMAPMKIQETYYCDLVNLPVAAPQAGSPSQKGHDTQQAPVPPPAAAPPMALPTPLKPGAKAQPAKQPAIPNKASDSTSESSSEFAERMSKLERASEAKQQEARIARLQENVKNRGSSRAGMPGGVGKEAGSSYEAYIKSRLMDAFRDTISYNSKNPKMIVRIFIDSNGKLSRTKTESSSGDRAFEISVLRAIEVASEKFPPPPNHKIFELGVIFSREGVTQNQH